MKRVSSAELVESDYEYMVDQLKNNLVTIDKDALLSSTFQVMVETAAAIVVMRRTNKNLDVLSSIRQKLPSYMRDDGHSITMIKYFVYGVLANALCR